jgi:hypothetical protein
MCYPTGDSGFVLPAQRVRRDGRRQSVTAWGDTDLRGPPGPKFTPGANNAVTRKYSMRYIVVPNGGQRLHALGTRGALSSPRIRKVSGLAARGISFTGSCSGEQGLGPGPGRAQVGTSACSATGEASRTGCCFTSWTLRRPGARTQERGPERRWRRPHRRRSGRDSRGYGRREKLGFWLVSSGSIHGNKKN